MRGLVLAEGGLRLEALGADRAAVHLVGVVHVQVLLQQLPPREPLPAMNAPENKWAIRIRPGKSYGRLICSPKWPLPAVLAADMYLERLSRLGLVDTAF